MVKPTKEPLRRPPRLDAKQMKRGIKKTKKKSKK